MIPLHVAASIVVLLQAAVRHLREAHSIAYSVGPPEVLGHIEPVWRATASVQGMLLAIWEAYPELDKRDGSEGQHEWLLNKQLWEWARAWQWGTITRQRLLSGIEQANYFLGLAVAAVAGSDTAEATPFRTELAHAVSIVRTAGTTLEADH